METKKIRIGNDIRLAVDLRQYLGGGNRVSERFVYNPESQDFEGIDNNPWVNWSELYHPNQLSESNEEQDDFQTGSSAVCIRSIKAVLVNTTLYNKIKQDLRNKTRFIDRFPIEPRLEAFRSTPYDVCNSGYPVWRAIPVYPGFGINHPIGDMYKKKLWFNDAEYIAKVIATNKQNIVEVQFPAEHQRYTGTYKLVVVVKLYAPGFNEQNLKTVTLDIPDVFELVSTTAEGSDSGFIINVTNIIDQLPAGDDTYNPFTEDMYVRRGEITDNSLVLNRTDDSNVDIDISSVTGWYDVD